MNFKLFVLISISFYLISTFFPSPVKAQAPKFSVFYGLDYQFQESGMATVKLKTILTNLTSDFIANKTTINLGKIAIQNAKASDNQGALKIISKLDAANSQIILELPNASSGKDSQYSYSVSYQTPDLVAKQGNLYQITIPNPAQHDPQVDDFRIHVTVPKAFGKPSIVRPESADLVFTKANLGTNNVFLTYNPTSTFQTYAINIDYHLENRSSDSEFIQIPIPASNAYQNFFWTHSTPRPFDTTTDDKGNWWAKFYLGSKSVQEVTVVGTVQTFDLPILENYLPRKTPSPVNPKLPLSFKSVAEIYAYVTKNFHYSAALTSKRSPSELLAQQSEVSCEEMTQLIQDLSASNGLQVEQVYGLVFPNQNSLHCWLAYFDPISGKPVAIDPALEQSLNTEDYLTNWDLTHIFLLTGKDKSLLSSITSFEAKPTIDFPEAELKPDLSIRSDFPKTLTSGSVYEGKIIITNSGSDQTGPINVFVTTKRLKVNQPIVHFVNLPPYATREIPIAFDGLSWTDSGDDIITLKLGDKIQSYPVTFQPFFASQWLIISILIACVLAIFHTTKITRRLHFPR